MTLDKRLHLIRTAGIIALLGNTVLALLKLIVGFASGSLAVIGDGIDSTTDVGIALMTLLISAVIARPSDKEHPWGHGRAETTATMVLSFMILFAGAQLFISAFQSIKNPSELTLPSLAAVVVSLVSIAGKFALMQTQLLLGKRANSSMVLANAQNMRNDIIISVSVLIGIGGAYLFKLPLLDPIAAILVSIWVIKNAVKLFLEINTELMDGTTNQAVYDELFAAIKTVNGATRPHRARIRKIASKWDIDLDIEVDANMSVHDAHEIAEDVADAIKKHIPDVYDVMVHVEPAGHDAHHPTEQYGLSETDIQNSTHGAQNKSQQ